MADDLKPCPFCNAEMQFEESGYEHPYSDTCPLDSLYIEDGHVAAWNSRATPTVQEAAKVLLAGVPNPIFDDLKPVLMGEFKQDFTSVDEDGDEIERSLSISWDVTKQIIHAALRAIAGDSHD